jgi:hypothetical protein
MILSTISGGVRKRGFLDVILLATISLPEVSTYRRTYFMGGLQAEAKPIRLYNGTRHSVGTQRGLEDWSREDISRLLGHSTLAHTDKYIDSSQVEALRNKMSVSKPFQSVNHFTKVSGSQTDD